MLRLHMGHVERPLLHQDTMHSLQDQQKLSHRVCTGIAAQPARWRMASPQASRSIASRHAVNRQHSTLEASSKDAAVSRRVIGHPLLAEPVPAGCAAGSLETLMADGALWLVLWRHSREIWLECDAICAAGLWMILDAGWKPAGLRDLQCSTGSQTCSGRGDRSRRACKTARYLRA